MHLLPRYYRKMFSIVVLFEETSLNIHSSAGYFEASGFQENIVQVEKEIKRNNILKL